MHHLNSLRTGTALSVSITQLPGQELFRSASQSCVWKQKHSVLTTGFRERVIFSNLHELRKYFASQFNRSCYIAQPVLHFTLVRVVLFPSLQLSLVNVSGFWYPLHSPQQRHGYTRQTLLSLNEMRMLQAAVLIPFLCVSSLLPVP